MIKFKKKNSYIGIDIGASSIKAVEIEKGPAGELTLNKANIASRAEGLKKALSGISLKGAKIIGIADCPATCMRYLTIPVIPDKELAEAVKWGAKDKISLPLEEASIGYEVQGEAEEAGIKKLKVKLAASPRKVVDEAVNLLSEAGMEPVSLITPPLALEHLSGYLDLNKDEAAAIIDISLDFTEINIMKGNSLKFHRKISSGGSAITKALASVLVSEQGRIELKPEDAEAIKIKYGIPKESGPDLLDGKITSAQLISLIRPATERLFQEIERTFEYYREESRGDKVKSVVLFGGGAQLKGLPEFLQENLGVPVRIGDSIKRINLRKGAFEKAGKDTHRFANAIGAALSEGRGINLLPIELKRKTVRTFERAAAEAVTAGVVVILISVFIGMQFQLTKYNEKIKYGNEILNKMAPELQIASNYERLRDEASEKQAFIDRILARTPPWSETFKELSNKMPREIVFTEMRSENNELFIKGEIAADIRDREEALSNFISMLEGGLFSEVSLVTARMGQEEKSKSEFEIKCVF